MRPELRAVAAPLALVVAIVLALAVFAGSAGLATALVGALLIIGVPGAAAAAALEFNRMDDTATRIGVTIALGFVVTTAGGLLLDVLPGGLNPGNWAIYLVITTIAFTAFTVQRRRMRAKAAVVTADAPIPAEDLNPTDETIAGAEDVPPSLVTAVVTPGPEPSAGTKPRFVRARRAQAIAFVVAIAITGISVGIARNGQVNASTTEFTQFWILPLAPAGQISIGIHNQEGSPHTYRIRVSRGGAEIQELPGIRLDSGGTFTATVEIPGGPGRVDADLFDVENPNQPYRTVFVWMGP